MLVFLTDDAKESRLEGVGVGRETNTGKEPAVLFTGTTWGVVLNLEAALSVMNGLVKKNK